MKNIRILFAGMLLFVLTAPLGAERSPIIVPTSGPTTVLPISSFVSAQNASYCKGYGFILWEDSSLTRLMYVDYYGFQNSNHDLGLGTTTDGVVTETSQEDGRVRVHVVLHTSNALTWVDDDKFPAPTTLLFGHTPAEVQSGAAPAIGDSTLISDFLMPRGPLPDFCQLYFAPTDGQQLISLSFTAAGEGALRAGSGLAEGTPGAARTAQEEQRADISSGGVNANTVLTETVNIFALLP